MERLGCILFFCLCTVGASWAQVTVATGIGAEAAVDVLTPTSTTYTTSYSGTVEQLATFEGPTSNLPITAGVVLSTGDCLDILPPNASSATASQLDAFAVDADLMMLTGQTTLADAAVLEFDFVATGEVLTLPYSFASEEYLEFVGSSFNDALGIFISGPGLFGPFSNGSTNIAEIPVAGDFISINTINPDSNATYYVDNPFGTGTYDTEMDGFTAGLFAQANLICGQTYHLKIAIADAGDGSYDSCVYLGALQFENTCTGIEGCTDPEACNYNPQATTDNNTCTFPGCTDNTACNYDDNAGCESGACLYIEQDSDQDELPDCLEVLIYGTDPNDADSDDDGLTDGAEILQTGTHPLLWDSNENGCSDLDEIRFLCPDSSTCTTCPSDLNHDGTVDAQDILVLIGTYGFDCDAP